MFCSTRELDLHLVRHAEAYKNLEKIHGGGNQQLTARGVEQTQNISHYLLRTMGIKPEQSRIIHQPEGRSRRTAEYIGAVIASEIICNEALSGVGLGVATGLSESELAIRYPEILASLVEWRRENGRALNRPKLPGSEPMEHFAGRVRKALRSIIGLNSDASSLIIVGTTSTLIMMTHLLRNNGAYNRPCYEFIDFPLGSVSTWRLSGKEPLHVRCSVTPDRQEGLDL